MSVHVVFMIGSTLAIIQQAKPKNRAGLPGSSVEELFLSKSISQKEMTGHAENPAKKKEDKVNEKSSTGSLTCIEVALELWDKSTCMTNDDWSLG